MPKAAGGGVGQMRVRVGELRDKLKGYARMLEEDNVWARGIFLSAIGLSLQAKAFLRL